MYRDNYEYTNSAYENSYNNEFEMELDPELELNNEYDNEYNNEYDPNNETQNSYEMEDGYANNYELDPELEIEEEADYEKGYEMENEYDQEYGSGQDEMEAELEYVTNEDEFGKWVNKLVGKAGRALAPILRTPLGKRAVKQFSKIAFKRLPYIGRKRPGWKRPYQNRWNNYNRFPRPGYRRWHHRPPGWRNNGFNPQLNQNTNFQQPQAFPNQDMQQPQGFPNTGMPQQPQGFQSPGMQQQPQGFQNTDAQQPAPIEQDGSFKKFVVDTIKNLSEQIAKGNESIMALKSSMTTSAVNNLPAIVQPKTGNPDEPAQGNAPSPDGGTATPPPAGEFEWQDNEYDNEYDNEDYRTAPNYEYDNESGYGYNNERETTDNESGFSEAAEMELASELLSVNSEMELDYFFGSLLKKALGKVTNFLGSKKGGLLKKALSKVIGTALPIVGGVVGGPVGAAVGSSIGSAVAGDNSGSPTASELFNLELEGLSNEDNEFEIARAFVRFAGNAVKEAYDNETGNPVKDAEHALIRSAQRFAPGLLRRRNDYRYGQDSSAGDYRYNQDNDNSNNMGDNGRWYRRGNKIIIQGGF